MSNLDFIEKLLDGVEVEWQPLGRLAENLDSMRRPITSGLREPGEIPYYGASGIVDYVKDYIFDGDFLLVSEDGANLIARNTPIAFSISGKSWVNNHAHILKFNTYVERRFVDIYLNSIDLTPYISGAAQPKLNQKNLNSIQIPIPCPENPKKSLEIKAEIVRILDAFTALTAELTAELTARKKQYNYYRDQLLSFEEGEVEWKTLGEVAVDKFWIMPATPKFDDNAEVPYITSKNIHGGHIDFKKVKFISRQDYLNLSRNRPILAGDFLISMIGTIGEVARVKDSDLDFYGQNMYLIRLNHDLIHSGYFLHFFDSPKMKGHFNAVKNNSGQGYLRANNIDDICVPLPPLEEQARIVAILDKLDALTNSITEGLPREIELRQKQYEYYRDLLLSFPKTEKVTA